MRKFTQFLAIIVCLRHRHPYGVYVMFVAMLAIAIAEAGATLVNGAAKPVASLMQLGDVEAQTVAPRIASAVLETSDLWLDGVKATFRKMERGGNLQSSLGAPLPALEGLSKPDRRIAGTHRTMCVRLCDGYYFPISYATTRDRFDDDERTCQQSCSSPAKLYAYPNPGGEPDDMVSIKGEAYFKLPNAFKFRRTFNQSCKCNANPWEAEAMARHQRYAEEASRKQQQQQVAVDETGSRKRSKSLPKAAERPSPPQPPLVARVSPVAPETMRPLSAVSGGSAAAPILLNSASLPGPRHGVSPKASAGEKRASRDRSATAKPGRSVVQADALPARRANVDRVANSSGRGTARR